MYDTISGHVYKKYKTSLSIITPMGLGYEVFVNQKTFKNIQEGEPITLFTRVIIRETSQTLFGFEETSHRDLYDKLLKITGVGPNLAIGLLSPSYEDLIQDIQGENNGALCKREKVGPKLATKIIAEKNILNLPKIDSQTKPKTQTKTISANIIKTLKTLGIAEQDAYAILQNIDEDKTDKDKISYVLKTISK